jgi:hypothetical protein
MAQLPLYGERPLRHWVRHCLIRWRRIWYDGPWFVREVWQPVPAVKASQSRVGEQALQPAKGRIAPLNQTRQLGERLAVVVLAIGAAGSDGVGALRQPPLRFQFLGALEIAQTGAFGGFGMDAGIGAHGLDNLDRQRNIFFIQTEPAMPGQLGNNGLGPAGGNGFIHNDPSVVVKDRRV